MYLFLCVSISIYAPPFSFLLRSLLTSLLPFFSSFTFSDLRTYAGSVPAQCLCCCRTTTESDKWIHRHIFARTKHNLPKSTKWGSAVKGPCCSSRGTVFDPQYSQRDSQLSLTPILEDPIPSSNFWGHQAQACSTCIQAGKTLMYKIKWISVMTKFNGGSFLA